MTTPPHHPAAMPDPLDPEAFRALAHRAVDWIADYWHTLQTDPDRFPVLSRARPGEVLAALPDRAPAQRERGWEDELFRDLDQTILPALTHWQHPRFAAFFPANASGPAVVGDLLSAGLGVQGMLWATSPACTELETRVLDWLGHAIGLPGEFLSTSTHAAGGGGVIQGTASEAALVALVAGRHRARAALGKPDSTRPTAPPRFTAYASTQAHSSIMKAAMIAGMADGPEDDRQVRLIDVDDHLRMRPESLGAALGADLAHGAVPAFICATVGTTSTTAIDDVRGVAEAIAKVMPAGARPWLHVDAAHAGAACVCPEFQHWLHGAEHADSVCFNPHKWLLTSFDCDCLWTRDRACLTGALSITPEYLRNPASAREGVIDYRDWQVPLGRRFRALKLWMVLRAYGIDGLRTYIREHIRLAGLFETWVRGHDAFEVCAPRTMNLVCFRLRPRSPHEPGPATDARNRALLDALQADGRVYLTHTTIPAAGADAASASRLVLRMAIGASSTREQHVREMWELIRDMAAAR